MGFIAQCYEETDSKCVYTGFNFESGHVGGCVPVAGDTITFPDAAFEVVRRIIEPDLKGGPAMLRLIVTRTKSRRFVSAEGA